ncbi:MAG TPA: hypothetical protein VGM29_03840 [Polyangiaceae bacterium]|jgi:hypothetical protein
MRGNRFLWVLGFMLSAGRAGALPLGESLERGSGGLFNGPAAVALPSSSSLWLSLGAGISRGVERTGWQAFLALGVPFDRLAAPPRPAPPVRPDLPLAERSLSEDAQKKGDPKKPEPAQSPHGAPKTPAQSPAPGETPPAASPAPPPAPAQVKTPNSVRLQLTPALARGAVRRALVLGGFLGARGRLSNLATRARASAALPELRLRALRSNGQTLRLTPTLGDPYQYTEGGTNELLLEARMTWRFDRLVFADEEVGIERLESDRIAAERKLLEHVLSELAIWQRGLVRAADEDLEPEVRETAELESLSALVELDVLTDGWFSGAIGEQEPAFAADAGKVKKSGVDPASHAR